MSKRIATAIVGVTAVVLLALGIPLAVAIHHTIVQSEVVELQAAAARALAEISVPLHASELVELRAPDRDQSLSVYDVSGRRLTGDGPADPDDETSRALAGTPTTSTNPHLVAAYPITFGTDENVVGALRLDESSQQMTRRILVAWLVMVVAGLAALAGAWLIAHAVARRLARPVVELARLASESGRGWVIEQPASTGVAELDALGAALADSSRQSHEALARERRFSADVSHQLRTPLTHLRLALDRIARDEANDSAILSCLTDLDRVDATVHHLSVYARETIPHDVSTDLDVAAAESARRWQQHAARRDRQITLVIGQDRPHIAHANPVAVDQTLDVLIDNALRHGAGLIQIQVRTLAGGVAIDINDEGSDTLDDTVFERGTGHGHGIGLALARSLIEAEGGRLILSQRRPPTFSLVLLDDSAPAADAATAPTTAMPATI